MEVQTMRRSPRIHRPPRLLSVMVMAVPLLLFLSSSSSFAAASWQPVEVVDSPVDSPAPSPGVSVLFSNDQWHVVYVKDGAVYHRVRAASGWLDPEQLSDPLVRGGPSIAEGGGFIHVVWHQAGNEIHTVRWDGATWSSDECLNCTGVPAGSKPVIAGYVNRAIAAWSDAGSTRNRIRGRVFENGSWGSEMDVSDSPQNAGEPTISEAPSRNGFYAAWTDDREGAPQVWVRTWDPYGYPTTGWQTSSRVTNVAGGCARPSIHGESCCYDVLVGVWVVLFETPFDDSADHEVYAVVTNGNPFPLSAINDQIVSELPNAGGYALIVYDSFGGPNPETYMTWTDRAGNPNTNWLARYGSTEYGPSPAVQILTTAGLSSSVIGAAEGNPDARLMAAWVEDRDGVPTLVAKRATAQGVSSVPPSSPHGGLSVAAAPNPCRGAVALQLQLPKPGTVEVRVHDATGREVRHLGRSQMSAGPASLSWDTRDAAGRVVAPGLYYAVVRAGELEARRSIIVLK
jgi:hypothetical protein